MNKVIFFLIFFMSSILCVPALAHKDRIISIEDGKLIGLPEKYHPAYLDLINGSLQIGPNEINFPPCISKYFPANNQFEIQVKSSWYHDLSILPPYISIAIQPKGKDYCFDLIFDMDTLKPLKFEIQIRESDSSTSYHQILIDKNCQESINSSYIKVKQ